MEFIEFIEFEIIAQVASPRVLLGTAVVALVFLTGLAAKAQMWFEDLCYRWSATPLKSDSPRAK